MSLARLAFAAAAVAPPPRLIIVAPRKRETRVAAAEWGELMLAAQAGHGGAYRRLLGEIRPWLLRYYARRLPPASVDDAVQEAMIAVHTKRATYDPERPFGPWLAAIARYKWIDRLRAMKRTAADALPDDIAVGDHESAVTSASVLRSLLATLKAPQALAIKLVKLDGLSIEEASAATGQSASLVKVNIHRGLARLTARLAAMSDGDALIEADSPVEAGHGPRGGAGHGN